MTFLIATPTHNLQPKKKRNKYKPYYEVALITKVTSYNKLIDQSLTTKNGAMATRFTVQRIPLVSAQLLQGQTLT